MEKIKNTINFISKDNFIKNNIIFFFASLVIGFLNYIYYPILGRILSNKDFGEFQALIAIFTQESAIFTIFTIPILNIIANVTNPKKKHDMLKQLKNVSYFLVTIIFITTFLFINNIREFLNFSSNYPILITTSLLFFLVPFTFRNAYLQGNHDFKNLSISGILFSASKILFSVILVYLGWTLIAPIIGILIAQILTVFFLFIKSRDKKTVIKETKTINKGRLNIELKYILLVFLITSSITFMFNADIIYVKHFFPSALAGSYAKLSVLAKIIFFVTGSIASVLIPSIKISNAFHENERILIKSFLTTILIGGSVLTIFCIFPEIIINELFGSQSIAIYILLPPLAISLFLVSINNLILSYYMALKNYFSLLLCGFGIISTIVILYIYHSTLSNIVYGFLTGNAFIMVELLLYILYNHIRYKLKSRNI